MSKYRSGKRYADILTILLIIVIIAIIGLLSYFGYKAVDKKNTQETTASAVEEFKKNIIESKDAVDEDVTDEGNADLSEFVREEDNSSQGSSSTSTKSAPKKTYLDGYEIKGVISISKTGIEYPILERVTVDSLSKSVAILDIVACPEIQYQVTELNVPGTNAFILGHNYRNGLFFSDNSKLSNGDKIKITDAYGETITYTIYEMFYTDANDISFMERDLDPNTREITLQTCNEDSSQRLIIQAKDN